MKFESLGIPPVQIGQLADHLAKAQQYVSDADTGPAAAIEWLSGNLQTYLPPEQAKLLFDIVTANARAEPIHYGETGYDSNQSRRQLSKVASDATLLGGMRHDYRLLGMELSADDVAHITGSSICIDPTQLEPLTDFAAERGGEQDYIFPGIVASTGSTPPLEDYAYAALAGKPLTSVRTITGVGGFRADNDWNFVTDLPTFAHLKIIEDRRYYPGLGIFHALANHDLDDLPVANGMKQTKPGQYAELASVQHAISNTPSAEYQGVSILCSAYVPKWHELKGAFVDGVGGLDLEIDFHSPSYEFMALRTALERATTDAQVSLGGIHSALKRLWSFNSTIHLPWTSKLAGLSNDLFGSITNHAGDTATRYGVGFQGKSLEIVKYTSGADRVFPYGTAGKTRFVGKKYNVSDRFEGEAEQLTLHGSELIKSIGRTGFLHAALDEVTK